MQLHAEATSTNALATAAPARNLVVVADHQTAGRGRLDRSWVVPRGAGLTFSAVVDPDVGVQRWPLLPLATGLAVVDAVRRLGPDAMLKWPNDVLVGERKLAGILVERVGEPALAVLGVGINVDMTADELPVPGATSMAVEACPTDRAALLGGVLAALGRRLGQLRQEPERLLSDYRTACATLGRPIQAFLPGDRVVRGTATDIDGDGRLVVETGTEVVAVSAGDVVHVRSAE